MENWLGYLNVLLVVAGYLLAFLIIMRIVLQRREPTATLAWVLSIILLPYIGVLMYLLVGRRRLNRRVRQRRVRAAVLEPHLDRVGEGVADLQVPEAPNHLIQPQASELLTLSDRMGLRAPTVGNKVRLLVANQAYDALEEAIRGAKSHIHLLYYIFNSDRTGARFRDLLIQKAREGVTVRLLVDGVGSFGASTFVIPLTQAGGKFAEFLPVGQFSRHWHPNLRNHRKIAVVDGRVGFTGGVNIGDEYTGRKKKVGRWRDSHIQISGPAVNHLQEVFAEDWYFASGEDLISERFYPDQQPVGDQMVQIIASGPDTETQPLQRMFFTAITSARKRVYLTTPYFVPDQAMLVALQTAALRGVEVKLLLPHRSDMTLVLHAGRSYYKELLESGVAIHEYMQGILHAKTMVVDDRWATVGSANMDVRSFKLNFEVNAVIYGAVFAGELVRIFERDLTRASQVTLEDVAQKSLRSRMAEGFARVLSPVL
jgi:cardiolipin synthase